ncbi:ATP synthase subunit b [Candidatus Ecksteinia adelgidicola]|nr:ATP synthase subunit b [Candidatus Ecksteinia adelgidicola]
MNLNATIFGQAITFFLFVWFCMKYVWPPIIDTIKKRQKEISDSLALAERAKKDLEIAKINATNCIESAQKQAKKLLEKINTYNIEMINQAKMIAIEEHNRIIKQAQDKIEDERKRASEILRQQISQLVITATEKVIEHSIDKKINREIIDKLISKL